MSSDSPHLQRQSPGLLSSRKTLLCGLLILCWSTPSWAQEMTPAQLLKANDKTWQSYRTIELELQSTTKYVTEGEDWSPIVSELQIYWATGDGVERYTSTRSNIGESTDQLIAQGEESLVILSNTYPSSSLKRPAGPRSYKDHFRSLLGGQFLNMPGVGTLQDVFAKWKLTKRGPIAAGNERLWVVKAVNPQFDPNQVGSVLEIEVTFNQTRGCLIQRLEHKDMALGFPKLETVLGPRHHVFEVQKFRDVGKGLHFPEQVVCSVVPDKAAPAGAPANECSVQYTATKLAVNRPLSAAARDFRVPENMVVTIHGAKGVAPRFAVWGADNRPAREFANEFELSRYLARKEGRSFAAEVAKRVANKLLRVTYPWLMEIADGVLPRDPLS